MQKIQPADENRGAVREGDDSDHALASIEDLAAAAEGILYCNAQRRKLSPSQALPQRALDAAIFRVAEKMDDELWDNLRQLSTMLAEMKSADIGDIRAKIRVWKSLAPESIFDEDEQTIDEALLCSIIDEIEQLNIN